MKENIRTETVRCIWFGAHYTPEDMSLRSGEMVEVHFPGWWNVEDGPTFVRAELEAMDRTKLDPKEPVDIDCFANMSDVPENPECGVVVVFFDDQPDRELDVPVIVLEDCCDDDITDLLVSVNEEEK